MKPPVENMSDYCKSLSIQVFKDLILHLNAKYLVVTYNNTYKSKSHSSRNKVTHDEILGSLTEVGKTRVFEMPFKFLMQGRQI